VTHPGREDALRRADTVKGLIQGEVLELADVCVVIADAAWPLDDSSEEAAAETSGTGLVVVPEAVDVVVLLTQTCDIQSTTTEERHCQVAPVLDRGSTFARETSRGRRPGWVALPWYTPTAVAELSRITTLERSVIVDVQSLGRPTTSREQLHFAEAVSRHFTRPALPDDVVTVLRPFLERMKERHDRASNEGRCIEQIATLRLEAVPDLNAPTFDLTILVVLETEVLPCVNEDDIDQDRIDALVARGTVPASEAAQQTTDPIGKREAWTALAELWLQPAVAVAQSVATVDDVAIEVLNGDELSFARSRNSPELDLAYLTTRPR
jgi:hypothetical protein